MAGVQVNERRSRSAEHAPAVCNDRRSAVAYLEALRGWDERPRCPACRSNNVYQMRDARRGGRNRRFLWRCRRCNGQYTVRVDTLFEDSRIALADWCYCLWAACHRSKGVTANQISRRTGLTYKSSLFMMHRIRCAMSSKLARAGAARHGADRLKLTGTWEEAVRRALRKGRPTAEWPPPGRSDTDRQT